MRNPDLDDEQLAESVNFVRLLDRCAVGESEVAAQIVGIDVVPQQSER